MARPGFGALPSLTERTKAEPGGIATGDERAGQPNRNSQAGVRDSCKVFPIASIAPKENRNIAVSPSVLTRHLLRYIPDKITRDILNRALCADQTSVARFLVVLLAVMAGVCGQTSDFQDSVRSAMAASIEKQKASIRVQAGSANHTLVAPVNSAPAPAAGFYSVDWPAPPQSVAEDRSGSRAFVDCDPMPEADLGLIIKSSSEREGVNPDLVREVIRKESAAKPCAVSAKGAQGLMQLMPGTADELGVEDPMDPRQNVEAGTRLLKRLLTKYQGDVGLALGAYNAGSGAVDREGGIPNIPETLNYVTDILSRFRLVE